jgi:endonuclease YncB( thermonuclease family)
MAYSLRPPPLRHARRPRPRPRRRARRDRFALWLALAVCGGFAGTLTALQAGSVPQAAADMPFLAAAAPAADGLSARFGFCHTGGGRNCVVDGDTFWFEGEKYRIADIDTPETHPPRCAEEAALGKAATERLRRWLNEGAFSLESIDRDTDRYGRKLRIVTRGGASVGDALVGAGLARRWEGHRRPWC